jgi:hypothetical protein
MKTLKTQFRKNDLFYTLVCRNDKVAMYETRQEEKSTLCHYEVARIYIEPAHTALGVKFEKAEVLTSNGKFFYDGSGAFIKKDNAMKHFLKLSDRLTRMPKQPLLPGVDLPE